MADITMPQLGETVTEGTIIKWLKKVGEPVAIDEPLFEVSTDKVDSEVPSPMNGVLTEIFVQEGETADVGARLAVLGDAAGAAAPAPQVAAPAPAPAPTPPPPPPVAQAPAPTPPPAAPAPTPPPPPPAAEAPAPPPPPPTPAPSPAPAPAAPVAAPQADNGATQPPQASNGSRGALLSPVVRRLIAEHQIDPANIPGTGLGGRITREDVLGYIDNRSATVPQAPPAPAATQPAAYVPATTVPAPAPSPVASPSATSGPAVSVAPPPLGLRDEIIPFNAIRRVTAEHMIRSIATSAHTLIATEADFENVERVRRQKKDQFRAEEGVSLTYLPFVARSVVEVLRDYPHLNSSVGDNTLIVHRDINLGFAVDIDREGLIVPVVHNADAQSLRGLARSVADLASRARSRKLSSDDIVGGTFTITNPGPFGTLISAPIIAQPQVAILSTDGVKRKPVVVTSSDGSESIAIHSVGILALSFDHRAVDGAYAASFVRDVANVIETRDWSAEF